MLLSCIKVSLSPFLSSESNEKKVLGWGLKKKYGNNCPLFYKGTSIFLLFPKNIYPGMENQWFLTFECGSENGGLDGQKAWQRSSWYYEKNLRIFFQANMGTHDTLWPLFIGVYACPETQCDAGQKSLHWIPKWIAILVLFFLFLKGLSAWSQCQDFRKFSSCLFYGYWNISQSKLFIEYFLLW